MPPITVFPIYIIALYLLPDTAVHLSSDVAFARRVHQRSIVTCVAAEQRKLCTGLCLDGIDIFRAVQIYADNQCTVFYLKPVYRIQLIAVSHNALYFTVRNALYSAFAERKALTAPCHSPSVYISRIAVGIRLVGSPEAVIVRIACLTVRACNEQLSHIAHFVNVALNLRGKYVYTCCRFVLLYGSDK